MCGSVHDLASKGLKPPTLEHHSERDWDVVNRGVGRRLRAIHIVVSSLYECANTGVGERESNAGTAIHTEVVFALRSAGQTKWKLAGMMFQNS